MSRENSLSKKDIRGEVYPSEFMNPATEEGQDVQEVVREVSTTETSLRHYFYLEYKNNFPDG